MPGYQGVGARQQWGSHQLSPDSAMPALLQLWGRHSPHPPSLVSLTCVKAWELGVGLGVVPCTLALPCTTSFCPQNTVTVPS